METIYETYKRTLYNNCKNKELNLCEIRRNTKGNLQCYYHIKDKDIEGYKPFEGKITNQSKTIMRM